MFSKQIKQKLPILKSVYLERVEFLKKTYSIKVSTFIKKPPRKFARYDERL